MWWWFFHYISTLEVVCSIKLMLSSLYLVPLWGSHPSFLWELTTPLPLQVGLVGMSFQVLWCSLAHTNWPRPKFFSLGKLNLETSEIEPENKWSWFTWYGWPKSVSVSSCFFSYSGSYIFWNLVFSFSLGKPRANLEPSNKLFLLLKQARVGSVACYQRILSLRIKIFDSVLYDNCSVASVP